MLQAFTVDDVNVSITADSNVKDSWRLKSLALPADTLKASRVNGCIVDFQLV